jgi:hypothetical protein
MDLLFPLWLEPVGVLVEDGGPLALVLDFLHHWNRVFDFNALRIVATEKFFREGFSSEISNGCDGLDRGSWCLNWYFNRCYDRCFNRCYDRRKRLNSFSNGLEVVLANSRGNLVGLNRSIGSVGSRSISVGLDWSNIRSRGDNRSWSNVRSGCHNWGRSNIWSRGNNIGSVRSDGCGIGGGSSIGSTVGNGSFVGSLTLVPDVSNVAGVLIGDLVRHNLFASVGQNNLKNIKSGLNKRII